MKKFICIFLCSVIFIQNVFAINTSAVAAVLIDADTYDILYEKNSGEEMSMASTTKIMTAIIAIENADLSKKVTVKNDYTLVEGSSMYLKPDEVIGFEELLYGLMLMSGNDAAIAIANETTGDYDEFISLMNKKVEDLGLSNTSFANPNGLDVDNHYTTAYDLAVITAYALENDTFREIVSSQSYKSVTRTMQNHNKMLWLEQECIGVKTGYTEKSGRCLVSAYEFEGKNLVAVTLDAPSDWSDHSNMYEYGKSFYDKYNFYTKGEKYDIIEIIAGDMVAVEVVLAENVNLMLTAEQKDRVETEVFASKINYAPIKASDVYGEIVFSLDDVEIFRTNLIYSTDVNLEYVEPMSIVERFIDFIKNIFY